MAIVKTVDLHDFRQAFRNYNRSDNFSHEGLEVLFDHLEDLSFDLGEPVELDVIALCCGYSEGTPEEIAERYGIDLPEREEWMDDDDYSCEVMDAVRDYLHENTTVCGVTTGCGTIVYANF
jgi:phosphoribosylformylglycinamidine (FGAM) synthase-like amidotransferase family enzyme